ncbi:MAG: primosomal protein N', partial [Prevotellaceae bacterium]|nr:primosomal protein N' [Prevotellaceae bacterium]
MQAEIILPVPVGKSFTYAVPSEMAAHIRVGCRVVVPFGNGKLQTGIVLSLSEQTEEHGFEIKPVAELVDSTPVVGERDLRLWQWIADYYICALGDVMKAALPGGMKLASETTVRPTDDFDRWDDLTDKEQTIMRLLADNTKSSSASKSGKKTASANTVESLQKKVREINALKTIRSLIQK